MFRPPGIPDTVTLPTPENASRFTRLLCGNLEELGGNRLIFVFFLKFRPLYFEQPLAASFRFKKVVFWREGSEIIISLQTKKSKPADLYINVPVYKHILTVL